MTDFAEKKRAAVDAVMRDSVYGSAVKIIKEEGLATLTLERIAREIGVSRATLYNYFSDRADVLSFIKERVFEPLEESLDAIAKGNAASTAKLEGICTVFIDSIYHERALILAVFHDEMLEGSAKKARAAKRERVIANISGVIEEGIACGEMRQMSVRAAAHVVLGSVIDLIETMIYSGEFQPASEVIPPILNVIFGGVLVKS